MPRKRKTVKRSQNYKAARSTKALSKGQYGGSLASIFGAIKRFAKRHKVLSRGARAYSSLGLPHGGVVGKAGKFAGTMGYGKKRRGRKPGKKGRRKKGLGLARGGGSLRRAGGSSKRAGAGRGRKKTTTRRRAKTVFP